MAEFVTVPLRSCELSLHCSSAAMTPEREQQKLRAQFEVEGPSAVRHKVNSGFYWRDRHRAAAVEWLREKEEAEHASKAWGSRET